MPNDDPTELSRRRLLEGSAAAATLLAGTALAGAALAAPTPTTAARYALRRLREHGVEHLFGVPGATCDPLFAACAGEGLAVVITSSDLEAGLAADGYARAKGLAAVSVTYGVGTMSLLPAIAGAYAERSPVVLLNGGPTAEDLRIQRELGALYSHSTGRPGSDLATFREVTAYAGRAERAEDVPGVVDAALRAALAERRPVYVEIPKDVWTAACPAPGAPIDATAPPSGEEEALAAEIGARLERAARPVLLLGVELQRYGLQDEAAALVEQLAVPWTTTFLAKAVLSERTAGFAGVYGGPRSVPAVRRLVDEADLVLAIGCVLGRQHRELVTARIDRLVRLNQGGARFGSASPRPAALRELLAALRARPWRGDPARLAATRLPGTSFDERRASLRAPAAAPSSEPGLGYDEVLREVSAVLDEELVVLTDTSLSMFSAAELDVAGRDAFLCNGVWQAIGWSVGAAVGVGVAGERRPLVICGDGGFQMTAQALSTLARQGIRAIVVVLDNGVYGIEQWLLEPAWFRTPAGTPPKPYLALNRWGYVELARALGFADAIPATTVEALRDALLAAKRADGPVLIEATVRPHDLPAGLRA